MNNEPYLRCVIIVFNAGKKTNPFKIIWCAFFFYLNMQN